MIELVLLGVALLLVVACGLFVMAEFALITVNRSTVERLAKKGNASAKGVEYALSTLSTQLSSAQVGITITNLAIGFLAEPAIAHFLEAPLMNIGVPEAVVPGVALTLGIALATAITMIFGELVPKNIAISKPLGASLRIQKALLLFTKIIRGPLKVLNGGANLILKRFGVQPQEELASARSADELLSLVRRSAEGGTLAKETAIMLERSLAFSSQTALDVMTPRVKMKAIHVDTTITEALHLAKSSGLSRFPVYGRNTDDIVGVMHIKHAFGVPRSDRGNVSVRSVMQPPVFVPSTIELEPLLRALRQGGLQMAVVIDEFGGADGVVTIEDVLEELVGEVRDEYDHSSPSIEKLPDQSWLLSGLLRPDEIAEELGIVLPDEDEVETLGGLFIHHIERIPTAKDSIRLPAVDEDGQILDVLLIVERMEGNRIDRLKLEVGLQEEEAAV